MALPRFRLGRKKTEKSIETGPKATEAPSSEVVAAVDASAPESEKAAEDPEQITKDHSLTSTFLQTATDPQKGSPNVQDKITANSSSSPNATRAATAIGKPETAKPSAPDPIFHSRRIKKGNHERRWEEKKDPKEIWVTVFPLLGVVAGLAVAALLIWDGLRTVINHKYCLVLDEEFSTWNDHIWTKEVESGGFGNGQFEVTTATDENVFIRDHELWIKPTLQDERLINHNTIIDLRSNGCTSSKLENCYGATNTTNGTIVNPVKSARINTKRGASIKFGRVEVVAKLPAGDWLWPAIWMLPVNNTYGEWPRSGEIDIIESRGNNYSYGQGGNNIVSSTLHFGPDEDNDGWWKNNVKRSALHSTFNDHYHVFGVEWSENYIFTYIDTRLLQISYTHFSTPFFQYGAFPIADRNGTRLIDPWSWTGRHATPFDQDFYLILDVAVGGTNGWFKDGKSGKPWFDASETAKKEFWDARAEWWPTWEKKGQMQVKSVKMWQQAGYNGCKL